MIQLGPLAVRWYGFLIALGVLIGSSWSLREAEKRGLDTEKLLDMTLWLVIAGLIGARFIYVITSPSAYFGPGGNPLNAFAIWQGGGSIHGGVLGIFIAVWLYSRIHGLNMWSYLDVLAPVGALGVIGGRIGNFMNGSDTTGRLTGWPIGYTWPEPGTDTFGAFGRFVFGDNLWAAYPGTCSLGSSVSLSQCVAQGGEILRGSRPPHANLWRGYRRDLGRHRLVGVSQEPHAGLRLVAVHLVVLGLALGFRGDLSRQPALLERLPLRRG